MTEEEKITIEDLRKLCIDVLIEDELLTYDNYSPYEIMTMVHIVLNLVKKQQEEIEHQIEKRNNQKVELAILNEKQKEFNKLTNTVKSYEGQFKRQQKELKKKDKIIDELEHIFWNYELCEYEITDCTYRKCEYIADDETPPCKQCIKQYFENKVEGE